MFKVIGVAAQFRNGKDTVADYLAERLNKITDIKWNRVAFANAVKNIFADAFGVDRNFIEEWKVRDESPAQFKMPVRKALQFIGDGFRGIKEDIWIEIALRSDDYKIISDARYLNEANMIKNKNGFNILIWRPGYENDDPCASEAEIKPLVLWCAENLRESGPIISDDLDRIYSLKDEEKPVVVNQVKLFDYFLVNEGGLESLYREIDEKLIPYILKEENEKKK